MSTLSEWLQLMLAEIARKQDEAERARTEAARRVAEQEAAARGSAPQDAHCRKTFHSG
jgi:hypothetical protein